MRNRTRLAVALAILAVAPWLTSTRPAQAEGEDAAAVGSDDYAGSTSCQECHADHYAGWQKTLHPYQEQPATPQTVLGDFSGAVTLNLDGLELRPFRQGQQYFVETPDEDGQMTVYPIVRVVGGNMYKQRYVTRLPDGSDAVLPIEWNMRHEKFAPYHAPSGFKPGQDKFWASVNRSWSLRCAGCHVVGLELEFESLDARPQVHFVELGVGCESCHGPGAAHAADPKRAIVNPAKLSSEQVFSLCASCHARGTAGPAEGSPVRVNFPVAFRPGDTEIHRVFSFSRPLSGLTTWAFWGNRRSRQHHQQANDFERSLHYQRADMSCIDCHESHGKQRYGSLREDPRNNALCLECHDDLAAPARLEAHTHHAADSAGSVCIDCHMPKVVTHANPRDLRSHTFWKPSPDLDAKRRVPEACTICHTGESREWAAEQVDGWQAR